MERKTIGIEPGVDAELLEQEKEERTPITPEQAELAQATGRYEFSECFTCGEKFRTSQDGINHASILDHTVLDYIGKAPVN